MTEEEKIDEYRRMVDGFTWPIEWQHLTTRADYEFMKGMVPEITGPGSGRLVRAFSKFLYSKS